MTLGFSGSSGPHVSSQLAAYHNGTLSSDERLRLRAHLETCSLCRTESNDWSAIAAASRSVFEGFVNRSASTSANSPAVLSTSLPIQFDQPLLSSNVTAISRKGDASMMNAQFAPTHGAPPPLRQQAFAPAALLVVVLAVAIAVVGLRPPGNRSDHRPSIPAAAVMSESTPSLSTPNPASEVAVLSDSCNVEPADLTRLDLIGATTYENAIPLPDGPTEGRAGIPADALPTGEPASDEQITEVTAAVQQLIDCIADGNATKLSALFTDDYWRRMNALGMDYDSSNARGYAPLVRPSSNGVPLMPTIEDVVVLPDGRLAASLIPTVGMMSRESFDFYVFAEVDGDLLIDEAAHSYDRAELHLQVNDDGFSDTTLLVTSGKTDLTVTNTGTTTHSFVVDELNIRMELEPGNSGTSTIVYEEATLNFSSDMPGDTTPGFNGTLTIDFPDLDSTPPAITPEPMATTCDVDPASESVFSVTGSPSSASVLVRPEDATPGLLTEIDTPSIPIGSYVSDEVANEINSEIATLAACLANGSSLQVASFFTEDYFRRLGGDGVMVDPTDAASFVPLQLPASEAMRLTPDVSEVILLPDGRIGAKIQMGYNGFMSLQWQYYVFANVGGTWLIDEATFVGKVTRVTLVVGDEGFEPTELSWTMGITELTVTNTGTRTHSFVEPVSGMNIEVAPGESESMTFIPGISGTFTFTSESDGDSGPGFLGTLVVTEDEAATTSG